MIENLRFEEMMRDDSTVVEYLPASPNLIRP
jgi:hypothetical protein